MQCIKSQFVRRSATTNIWQKTSVGLVGFVLRACGATLWKLPKQCLWTFLFSSILYIVALAPTGSFSLVFATLGCANFGAISCQSARWPRCSLWFNCKEVVIVENLVIKGWGGKRLRGFLPLSRFLNLARFHFLYRLEPIFAPFKIRSWNHSNAVLAPFQNPFFPFPNPFLAFSVLLIYHI